MGSRGSKAVDKVIQPKPVVVEPQKFTYKRAMPSRPQTSTSVDSTDSREQEEVKGTPPPPVVTWEEILSQNEEVDEKEVEREQYVAPRGTFPMGVGPYAVLGKPRKKPEPVKKKRKTPKPEAETIAELLMSDSEDEEDEEKKEKEEDEERKSENACIPRNPDIKTSQSTEGIVIRPEQTHSETPLTTFNDDDAHNNDDDEDDSDIEFGSQFSGMNNPETGPDVLFVNPGTNLPSKEIVGQGTYEYGRFPMSFSPVQSTVDLHAAAMAAEIRDTMEYWPGEDHTDTGLNAYFEAQLTNEPHGNSTKQGDGRSILADSDEEEEDTSWMEDGRTNKQLG